MAIVIAETIPCGLRYHLRSPLAVIHTLISWANSASLEASANASHYVTHSMRIVPAASGTDPDTV